MSVDKCVARAIGLIVATLVVPQVASAVPSEQPRQDVWDNAACHNHPPDVRGQPVTGKMLDFNIQIDDDVKSGSPRLQSHIDAAYAYAKAHCFPLVLGDADLTFDQGDYHAAFVRYRDFFFNPGGGQSINSTYDDLGATQPFKDGIYALADDEYKAATKLFRASIAKASDFQAAHYTLGNLYYAEGRTPEARKEWLAVLGSYGDADTDKPNFGPDAPWLSALRMYEIHR